MRKNYFFQNFNADYTGKMFCHVLYYCVIYFF